MNQQVLYIGQDDLLDHPLSVILTEILSESPHLFSNHNDAIRWLHAHPEAQDTIIFYERLSAAVDLVNIKSLRHSFPLIFILLITDNLPITERFHYIRAGVNDTVSPDTTSSEISRLFQFIHKYKTHNLTGEREDVSNATTFKLPLIKRGLDVVFSSLALLFFSPLMVIVALAIRLESKGPVFYKSRRVGSNYRIFDFWKFRSMYADADKRLKEMENFNQYASPAIEKEKQAAHQTDMDLHNIDLFNETFLVGDDCVIPEEDYVAQNRQKKDNAFVKIEKDPRVTKVGHFIRKYSIDELPQLINILKGDMSVVGNRPLPLYEAELLTKDNSVERFIAPAGLTGLWQVQKRGDAGKLSAEERKQLDIYYAQHYSLWLDIKIIFRTFTAFIQKEDV